MNAWVVPALLLAFPAWAGGPAPTVDPYEKDGCVLCHRNDARTSHVYEEWRQSVHYKNNVGCSDCHAGDPGVRLPDARDTASYEAAKQAAHRERSQEFLVFQAPESVFHSRARGRSVSYFCGRCHAEIKEKHLGSPHGDFGDPTCLYCHAWNRKERGRTTHAIRFSGLDIMDTRPRSEGGRCSPCHQAATMEAVRNLKDLLTKAEEAIETSADLYRWLEEHGYRNLELKAMTENSRQTRSRVRVSFHSFNMREIQDACRAIDAVADRTAKTKELVELTQEARIEQGLIGAGICVFLLAFVALLVYYKHAFCPSGVEAGRPE